jgi:hypothetical protein
MRRSCAIGIENAVKALRKEDVSDGNNPLSQDSGDGDRLATQRIEPASYCVVVAESFGKVIGQAVASWPGVTVAPHRFGGVEFRVGRRELGHLHGNRLADLPFPVMVREQLVAAGRAESHHVLPESGWVSVRLRRSEDVPSVIELFRLNYERGWLKATDPASPTSWRTTSEPAR